MIILLLVLGGVSWYLINNKTTKTSSIAGNERNFKLNEEEAEDLSRIVIKNRKLGNSEFTKKGEDWYLNEDIKADKYVMAPMLQAIQTIELDYIPHPKAKSQIIKEIGAIGILVELYGKNDKLMRSYYVGGSTSVERGCNYLMKGSNQPYVVRIPYMEGSPRNRFVVKENEFKDKAIIVEDEKDIVDISIKYPLEQNASFRIFDLDKTPKVEALYSLTNNEVKIANKGSIEAYMASFNKKGAEYIYAQFEKKDSIMAQVPFAIINYKTKSGTDKTIKIYPLKDLLDEDEGSIKLESLVKIERYYADCSWGDFLLLQQRVIGSWFRPYDFFVE